MGVRGRPGALGGISSLPFGPWKTLDVLWPTFCMLQSLFRTLQPAFWAMCLTCCMSNTNSLNFFKVFWAILTLLGLNQPALFSDGYFSMKKGVWMYKFLWLFLINYELSENQNKIFWFFTEFWGDLEAAGWFSPPPLSSNIHEPRSIRVNWQRHKLNPPPTVNTQNHCEKT